MELALVGSSSEDCISLLGDSQSVRMSKIWRKESHRCKLETSCAVSGWTTGQLKEVLKDRMYLLARVCVLFIAVNDIIKKVPLSVVFKNIKEILNVLKQHKRLVLFTTLPPILNCSSEQSEQVRAVNVYIQSFSTRPSVTVVPFHRLFPPFANFNPRYYQLRYYNGRADNVHLSAVGIKALMEVIDSGYRSLFN